MLFSPLFWIIESVRNDIFVRRIIFSIQMNTW